MINQLHLKNIKAWRDSGTVRLAPVTMLLGTHSSGKSTWLQSLLLREWLQAKWQQKHGK
jgi:predicted ATPase